jgi:Lysozyme like domain
MAKETSGIGLAAVAGGIVFIYGGIKGYSPLRAVQNIIQGRSGSFGQKPSQLTGTGGINSSVSSSTATYGGDVAKLWISLGGDPSRASVASCIASHESGGNPNATSSNPDGGTNVGLFQLDTPGGKGAGYTIDQLKDPVLNTKITIRATNNGRDWSAWSTAPMCGV